MGCSGRSEAGDRHRSGTGDDVVELHLLPPDPWSMNMINGRAKTCNCVKEKKGRTEENANNDGNSVPRHLAGLSRGSYE